MALIKILSIIMTQYQIAQQDNENYSHLYKLFFRMPKRQITNPTFNQLQQKKLLQLLTCKLCDSILNMPIYLRCCHRFCKECIEKYLRIGFNKCCPICRETLLSRRQARIDNIMVEFINLFRNSSRNQLQNKHLNLESTNGSSNSSQISQQLQQQWRRHNLVNYSKRTKNHKDKKIDKENKKKGKASQIMEDSNDETFDIITVSNEVFQDFGVQIISSSSDKRFVPFVLQEQQSYHSSSQQHQICQQKQEESISLIEIDTGFIESNSDDFFKNNQSAWNGTTVKQSQKLEEQVFHSLAEIENKCKNSGKNAYFQIKFEPYPNKIVPELQNSTILCPFDMDISKIKKLIGTEVNMFMEKVKLFVANDWGLIQIHNKTKLYSINEHYWHDNHYKIGTLSLMIRHLQNMKIPTKSETKRIIYYLIDF